MPVFGQNFARLPQLLDVASNRIYAHADMSGDVLIFLLHGYAVAVLAVLLKIVDQIIARTITAQALARSRAAAPCTGAEGRYPS